MLKRTLTPPDDALSDSALAPTSSLKDAVSAEKSEGSLLDRGVAAIRGLGALFLFVVVLPTVLATLYFILIASDVYISESRFVVRAPDRAMPNALGLVLRSAGWSSAGPETYAVRDYVTSRDALNDLNRGGAVEKAYSSKVASIFDRFNGFGWKDTNEDLYRYYLKKVAIEYDSTSSITTLQVRAFTAEDANRFNSLLLRRAEALVNGLNRRAQTDMIRLASAEVDTAKDKVMRTALALAAFRDQNRIVDPAEQASIQMQMVSKLQDELIATRMRLSQLRQLTPANPQIPVLEANAENLEGEIADETAKMVGGRRSLAGSAAQYQRVLLDNQFAEKQLEAAMAAYEEARSEALRKQAYIERIVNPSISDKPQEPRRTRGILTTLGLGLVAWAILKMLLAGVREHGD